MELPKFVNLIQVALFVLFYTSSFAQDTLKVKTAWEHPQIDFVLDELRNALSVQNMEMELVEDMDADILMAIDTGNKRLTPEGFQIEQKENGGIVLTGHDTAGLLYAGLELAEQIRLGGWAAVHSVQQNPYLKRRGSKFNIPLDVRTPSYTDASDTAQKNIPSMWDFDFWKEYIDQMARYRYNYISLWNLHPFPSLVEVPGYEDVALDDVQRSTTDWNEFYHLHATGLDTPEILNNPETVKQISIDGKIEFWRKVMRHGKDRNIDFHFITWNIFTNGTESKYGITDAIDNKITKDYFKQSVKQMFKTYPDLAGIGLTTGENMPGAKFQEKEDWAFDTYAQGILEVARQMPDRQFTFIHRQHQTGAQEIAKKFKPVIDAPNIDFIYSFKYAKAHAYSAVEQPYHEEFLDQIGDLKTIWGIRNDDTYYFRWGAPDFVRTFIKNLPIDVAEGIYFGSDQWVWGREFLTKDPETPDQLEIVKHGYQWELWGRLSYNPELENSRFQQMLEHDFSLSGPNSRALFNAWQNASMVYPVTTGFHWGALDFQWYIEGCISRPKQAGNDTGFHDVDRFISMGTHPKSGFQSIPDYVQMKAADSTSTLKSPLAASKELHRLADDAMPSVDKLSALGNRELGYVLNDIRTVSFMGKYYAHKIAGATHVAMYRQSGNENYQRMAVDDLEKALDFWKKYTSQALKQNKNPLWTNRVGHVDWTEITEWVADDIKIAKQNHGK